MIPDEIIRRMIPPAFAYKMPHSELIDQQEPTSLDLDIYSGHGASVNPPGKENSPDVDPTDSPGNEGGEKGLSKFKMVTPNIFPGSYARHIADQSAIAAAIRKYLSSNHVNPLGNSSYIEYRRRLARFSHSF